MAKFILPVAAAAALAVALWSNYDGRQPVQVLSAPGLATIPVAMERGTLDTMLPYDPTPGTVFRVPASSRVRVIDRLAGCLLVEVVGGTDAGRRGWVFAEWVSPK